MTTQLIPNALYAILSFFAIAELGGEVTTNAKLNMIGCLAEVIKTMSSPKWIGVNLDLVMQKELEPKDQGQLMAEASEISSTISWYYEL